MLVQIILLFVQFLVVLASAALVYRIWMVAQHFSVPYVPIRTKDINAALEALNLKEAAILYDLGSGDGRMIIAALRRFSRLRGVGIEARSGFVFMSKLMAMRYRISARAQFRTAMILDTDLTGATHVYTFLSDRMMAKLQPKFEKELKGARVVSLAFPLPDKKPTTVIDLDTDSKYFRKLYVYDYP